MRAKPFTFKKTRRSVTVHKAISVDLTVKEAEWLIEFIECGSDDVTDGYATPVEVAMGDLYDALKAFVGKKPERKLTLGDRIYKPGRIVHGDRKIGYVPGETTFYTNGKYGDGRGWRYCDTDEPVTK